MDLPRWLELAAVAAFAAAVILQSIWNQYETNMKSMWNQYEINMEWLWKGYRR
jgi:hypothetical protein